ncbi:alpha-galactosidase [Microbacterium suaedae]|uniref:alpha-galactosidase n=1 Tax=Microbacterium suaedae TaxID=2067813 RepID=UPI000DA2558F|nr:alpha-galactosidase [Microbacterium suaedae]
MTESLSPVLLRGGGASVVIALDDVPRVIHWGADVGPLDAEALSALVSTAHVGISGSEPDIARVFGLWATQRDGWTGTPTVAGHVSGAATTPRPRLTDHVVDGDARSVRLTLTDDVTALTATVTIALDAHGVLTLDQEITFAGDEGGIFDLSSLTAAMPVPERAGELLDFTGRWCRERAPQRIPFAFGTHLREGRRGRPGHDSPFLLVAGTPGFSFRSGEVWAAHLAWSGNPRYLAERLPEGAGSHAGALGVGEGLVPGEVRLAPGESHRAPTAVFVWSPDGLDGLAARLHARLRARPRHPRTPRPLVLNTWEAVYFDHDLATLSRLAERAARVGVERLVLDDGWFGARRDTTAGLGDWHVAADVWPEGLGPLVDVVRAHGMSFGLWFEPEMVNLDSDLARDHPEWILGPSDGLGMPMRGQHVLDLAHPDAWRHLLERISSLVAEYGIDYIKWDHNRELLEAVAQRDGSDRPIVGQQTRALYRLIDALRERHPDLEIESCSAGGARIDLGILERTDRVWASDCNDPVERGRIERFTSLVVPPEMIGGHIGPPRAHTTGRATDLPYRMAAALFGHAGIEWNLLECDDDELDAIAAWASLYKRLRPLTHTGRVVHADGLDEGADLDGVVAEDGSRAVYRLTRTDSVAQTRSGAVTFPGLSPEGAVRVRVVTEAGRARTMQDELPAWVQAAEDVVVLPAASLATVGLPLPSLAPQQALVIEIERL